MRRNFKGFEYYELKQDYDGNIKLSGYNAVLSARMARVDMLLDNVSQDDADFTKLKKAFDEKFMHDQELLSRIYEEDKDIALEKNKMLHILDNLDALSSIDSRDLLEMSLLLSDMSCVEKNIVLGNTELAELKDLFLEKKESGEYYTDAEYQELADYIDHVNYLTKMELIRRIEDAGLEGVK